MGALRFGKQLNINHLRMKEGAALKLLQAISIDPMGAFEENGLGGFSWHKGLSPDCLDEAIPQPRRPELQKPELEKPKRDVQPIQAQLSLPVSSLKADTGDLALDFAVRPEAILPPKTGTAKGRGPAMPKQGPLLFQLFELDGPPHALSRVEPIYPAAAKAKGIEGLVELEFVITPEGKVTDVTVMRSHPQGYFELFCENY